MKYNKQRPFDFPYFLQSHRGSWYFGAAENTLKSVQGAAEMGYLACEFDVRLTKDLIPVLFHDESLNGFKIENLTYLELISISPVDRLEDLFVWYTNYRKVINPLVKPQEDKLEEAPSNKDVTGKTLKNKYNFYLNIEIKSAKVKVRNLEEEVLKLIRKFKISDSILISSFNPLTLHFFKKNAPEIIRALLLTYKSEHKNNFIIKSQILNVLADPHFLHLDSQFWNKNKFKKLLKQKIPIILWTCNDLEFVEKAYLEGASGFISDALRPDEIKKLFIKSKL